MEDINGQATQRNALSHELVSGRSCFKGKIKDMAKRQTGLGKPGRP